MPVTLVVKTPHVKLPDLIFSCEPTSNVFQLKTYLQDQYPSKPVRKVKIDQCYS